jgi:CubicO group peptidase (beta-lactamase class C family)
MLTLALLSVLGQCPGRASWPTQEWPDKTAAVAQSRAAQVQALTDYAFTLVGADADRDGIRTDGLLVIKSGEIVYEKYGRGYSASNRHISWSVAKSITSALVGVAVNDGKLTIADSLCKYVSARDELCPITVRHMLEMGSGMHWQEEYENENYQSSSVISMQFGIGHRDMVSFVLNHKKEREPGTKFLYSTGEAHVLGEVVRQAMEPTYGKDWIWTELFNRIGMNSAVFQVDPKGTPLGGSYVFATPRDFARFAYLYLNDGCWEGNRLLPTGWVANSTKVAQTYMTGPPGTNDEPYGWMWWLNQVPIGFTALPWPDVPADTYAAEGHWGQYIFIVPSKDVVIVRTADDRDEASTDLNQLIKLSLEVAQ